MTDLSLLPASAAIEGEDLLIGGCRMSALAAEFGTPLYVLDSEQLRDRARRYLRAFTGRHAASSVCFATKAYPSASVLRVLVEEGLGCDVVGGGELRMALAAGADPSRIVMHGNAKTDDDIRAALDARIGRIVVDGLDEIDRIARLAERVTPVLLRVTPGIDAATHEAMATGGARSKFGVPVGQVPAAIERMRREPMIDLQGLHAHIGSQIADLDQFGASVAALAALPRFGVYDFGGGLGVRYLPDDPDPQIEDFADTVVAAALRHLGTDIEIIVEPGRSIVAPVGLTLYRIVTVKRGDFVHVAVDGGMGDNLEPSLYGQRFAPLVVGRWDEPAETVDLVGRHCESGDVLVPATRLRGPTVDDLLVVPVTGAYCFTMANNYNCALRPPVVFCADGRAQLAVRRETYAELMGRELLING